MNGGVSRIDDRTDLPWSASDGAAGAAELGVGLLPAGSRRLIPARRSPHRNPRRAKLAAGGLRRLSRLPVSRVAAPTLDEPTYGGATPPHPQLLTADRRGPQPQPRSATYPAPKSGRRSWMAPRKLKRRTDHSGYSDTTSAGGKSTPVESSCVSPEYLPIGRPLKQERLPNASSRMSCLRPTATRVSTTRGLDRLTMYWTCPDS